MREKDYRRMDDDEPADEKADVFVEVVDDVDAERGRGCLEAGRRANSIPIVVMLMNPRADENSHQKSLPGRGLLAKSAKIGPTMMKR